MTEEYIKQNLEKFVAHSEHEREKIIIKVLSETHYNAKIENFGDRLANAIGNKIFYDDIDKINLILGDFWPAYKSYKKIVEDLLRVRYIDTPFGKLNLLLVCNEINSIWCTVDILRLIRDYGGDSIFNLNDEQSAVLNARLMNIVAHKWNLKDASIKSYGIPYSMYLELKRINSKGAEDIAAKFGIY